MDMESFSPLAGIRYAETKGSSKKPLKTGFVSVPLRGLDMRKPLLNIKIFCLWKCFSPLAGIRYAETTLTLALVGLQLSFSPLAGIRYAETVKQLGSNPSGIWFQSPCGD